MRGAQQRRTANVVAAPPPLAPRAGSDGWFYPQHAAENASLREIIHDGFLYPKDSK